ncbi:hypothetical protein [Coraliomargarita akajimensis]|uniref:Uncharacterized protein n=1 Tax=Coraliomargarita akajimensis (strain DSM 45221 / IAM 15411 / JCM 23193 / KCTC 12865 / 04OKA010-24) TaxID=583355 RepID=D5EQC1_CORAD|nr:hypothetical protein [Coraliomargarita akajimensis]ADE53889.1 conserved hypothetical protein [Coraliomargarita akajimensis DSM 45221]
MEDLLMNLKAGWIGFIVGVLSGVWMGLKFHDENWLGGYGSHPRRMVRLGHIACFGMGLLNILFAFSLRAQPVDAVWASIASYCWLVALVSMPLICWLVAWRKPLRHLFPLPVVSSLVALFTMLIGWELV